MHRIVISEGRKELNILSYLYFFIHSCFILFIHLAYAERTATFLVDCIICPFSENKVHIMKYFEAFLSEVDLYVQI